MKFDHKQVEEKLRTFWRENKEKMHYFLCGKEVYPESVSSCFFQINEVESKDGYNFEVASLNLRVQLDSVEECYKANFLIKVVPTETSENGLPEEKIVGIQDCRITLRK